MVLFLKVIPIELLEGPSAVSLESEYMPWNLFANEGRSVGWVSFQGFRVYRVKGFSGPHALGPEAKAVFRNSLTWPRLWEQPSQLWRGAAAGGRHRPDFLANRLTIRECL